jgi:hypothetical protein
MGWASFLPYMSIPAWWNDGISIGPSSVYLASWSLADGYEARLVIVLLAVLGVGSFASLAGIRRRFSAIISLITSVGLVVLAQFLSGDGGRYVLPAWVLPGSGGEVAPVEPVTLGVGYNLFLAGAVLAVIASLIMVVVRQSDGLPTIRRATTQTT